MKLTPIAMMLCGLSTGATAADAWYVWKAGVKLPGGPYVSSALCTAAAQKLKPPRKQYTCVASVVVTDPPPAPLWSFLAAEGGAFTLLNPQIVRYGFGTTWIEKTIAAAGTCSNDFFGSDPLVGVPKSCELKAGPPIVLPPPPPVTDMPTGPVVNMASIPAWRTGYAEARVRTVWRDSVTGFDCVQGAPNCSISSSMVANPNVDAGAFRVSCFTLGYGKFDPIVFPNQPGASHLHAFFGNDGVSAGSTQTSLSTTGGSSCEGGPLNRSIYWMPAIIDTLTGNLVLITDSNFYYKKGAQQESSTVDVMMPAGMRIIAGNPKNTSRDTATGRFICYNLSNDAENTGWSPTIGEAVAKGKCVPGADLVIEHSLQNCWDGVNLDSPTHNAHVTYSSNVNGKWACPDSHKTPLVQYSINAHVKIVAGMTPAAWRLSSDLPDAAAGASMHVDGWWNWDKATSDTFMRECVNKPRDCHNSLLGDERTLY